MNTIYGCFSDPKYSIPSLFPEVVPDVQSCLSEPGLAHTQDILKESADNSLFHAEQAIETGDTIKTETQSWSI